MKLDRKIRDYIKANYISKIKGMPQPATDNYLIDAICDGIERATEPQPEPQKRGAPFNSILN